MSDEINKLKKYISNIDYNSINHYININPKKTAQIWPDYVNFEKRRIKEIPFLVNQIEKNGITNPTIFDSCLGTGTTSIGLKLAKFENIISNEIDQHYIDIAKQEATNNHVSLDITEYDWTKLETRDKFNVITCLGNSITYLFNKKDQIKTLTNFYNLLNNDGILVIDERNYPKILDGKFRHSGQFLYCNKDKVEARVNYASENIVIFEFNHKIRNIKVHIPVYPFKRNELKRMLKNVGFKEINSFGDYKENKYINCEFITYVCKK